MLGKDALEDRKWAGFPALRRFLAGRQLQEWRLTSNDPGWLDGLVHVLEITRLTIEADELVRANAQSGELRDDLRRLDEALSHISAVIHTQRDKLSEIAQ